MDREDLHSLAIIDYAPYIPDDNREGDPDDQLAALDHEHSSRNSDYDLRGHNQSAPLAVMAHEDSDLDYCPCPDCNPDSYNDDAAITAHEDSGEHVND